MVKEEQDISDIINGCKKGNRQAQEKLYRNYYRAVMNLCLRYTKNDDDALEVMNSGFYKVFKNIKKYNPAQASLYTWIRTIIINTCLDFLRAKESKIEFGQIDQAANADLPPEVISKMSAEEILRLVRQLPPATQTVFNLYAMEGYKHNEIAKLMNISEGTSKWHLSEARTKLQHLINEQQIAK